MLAGAIARSRLPTNTPTKNVAMMSRAFPSSEEIEDLDDEAK